MAERFRITDTSGTDVYLEYSKDARTGESVVLITADGDAQVPDTARLGMENAIALRDALNAFIDGRFDAFAADPTEREPND